MEQAPKRPAPFAKKSLGQNFLKDKSAVAKIVNAIPAGTPLLLEIGPGRGAISTELFSRAEKFCVLEKDDLFAEKIEGTLTIHGSRNHHVFHADALEFDWERLWTETGVPPSTPLTVAANLPYNVGTEILFRLVNLGARAHLLVLMFQKEVALRIAARAGTKAYGIISVLVQNHYDVSLQQILKPGAFVPAPKVDSAVIELRRRDQARVRLAPEQEKEFTSLVRAGFSHRRKTLENSLAHESGQLAWVKTPGKDNVRAAMARARIDAQARAETLEIEDWGRLHQELRG